MLLGLAPDAVIIRMGRGPPRVRSRRHPREIPAMISMSVTSAALVLALLAQPGAQPDRGGSGPKESGRKEDPLEQKDRAAVEEWIRHLSAAEAANAPGAPATPHIEPVQSAVT